MLEGERGVPLDGDRRPRRAAKEVRERVEGCWRARVKEAHIKRATSTVRGRGSRGNCLVQRPLGLEITAKFFVVCQPTLLPPCHCRAGNFNHPMNITGLYMPIFQRRAGATSCISPSLGHSDHDPAKKRGRR